MTVTVLLLLLLSLNTIQASKSNASEALLARTKRAFCPDVLTCLGTIVKIVPIRLDINPHKFWARYVKGRK